MECSASALSQWPRSPVNPQVMPQTGAPHPWTSRCVWLCITVTSTPMSDVAQTGRADRRQSATVTRFRWLSLRAGGSGWLAVAVQTSPRITTSTMGSGQWGAPSGDGAPLDLMRRYRSVTRCMMRSSGRRVGGDRVDPQSPAPRAATEVEGDLRHRRQVERCVRRRPGRWLELAERNRDELSIGARRADARLPVTGARHELHGDVVCAAVGLQPHPQASGRAPVLCDVVANARVPVIA